MFYLRGRHAVCMVPKIGSKDNLNFVSIILRCSCRLIFKCVCPILCLMDHASTSKNPIFAKWFRLFSCAWYTKHSFFKCYLISETTATVKWLQIRCNVVFRLLGVLYLWECNGKAFPSSNEVSKENTWEHADLQIFSPIEKQTIGITVCSYCRSGNVSTT